MHLTNNVTSKVHKELQTSAKFVSAG